MNEVQKRRSKVEGKNNLKSDHSNSLSSHYFNRVINGVEY